MCWKNAVAGLSAILLLPCAPTLLGEPARPEATAAGAWSRPVNGLRGRLVQKASRTIGGTEVLCVTVELENVSPQPLYFTTDQSGLNLDLLTSDGKKIPQAGVKRGGPFSYPSWGVIAPGSYTGFPLEYVALEVPRGQGAFLPLQMNRDWLLQPGKYSLQGSYTVPPAQEARQKDAQRWAGKLELPALILEVKGKEK